jgi:hypothetical protein
MLMRSVIQKLDFPSERSKLTYFIEYKRLKNDPHFRLIYTKLQAVSILQAYYIHSAVQEANLKKV